MRKVSQDPLQIQETSENLLKTEAQRHYKAKNIQASEYDPY